MTPLAIAPSVLRRELPFLVAVTLLLGFLAYPARDRARCGARLRRSHHHLQHAVAPVGSGRRVGNTASTAAGRRLPVAKLGAHHGRARASSRRRATSRRRRGGDRTRHWAVRVHHRRDPRRRRNIVTGARDVGRRWSQATSRSRRRRHRREQHLQHSRRARTVRTDPTVCDRPDVATLRVSRSHRVDRP